MTVTADSKQRIRLRSAKPGERFDVQVFGKDQIILRRLQVVRNTQANVRVRKVRGYTVAKVDHAVTDNAIKEALRELP